MRASIAEKRASRTRSLVGRVDWPRGVSRRRPPAVPPMMRVIPRAQPFSMNPEAAERSTSATAAARSGARVSPGSPESNASAASRARMMVFSSRSTRSVTSPERKPDWLAPRTSPSRRCSRSTRLSSKPSVVAATASRRSRAGEPDLGVGDQQAEAGQAAPADAAAELVELGDAEAVGVEQHHHRRVVDVDAHLDDGGRDQHVDLAGGERPHRRVLGVGGEPAVQHRGAQPCERPGGQLGVDVLDRRERPLGRRPRCPRRRGRAGRSRRPRWASPEMRGHTT